MTKGRGDGHGYLSTLFSLSSCIPIHRATYFSIKEFPDTISLFRVSGDAITPNSKAVVKPALPEKLLCFKERSKADERKRPLFLSYSIMTSTSTFNVKNSTVKILVGSIGQGMRCEHLPHPLIDYLFWFPFWSKASSNNLCDGSGKEQTCGTRDGESFEAHVIAIHQRKHDSISSLNLVPGTHATPSLSPEV